MRRNEKNIQKLEREIEDIRNEDKGKLGVFIQKYGMQFLVQTLSIIVAVVFGYATLTNSLNNILKQHEVMAQEIGALQKDTNGLDVVTTEIQTMGTDIKDIKAAQTRLEDKLDSIASRVPVTYSTR